MSMRTRTGALSAVAVTLAALGVIVAGCAGGQPARDGTQGGPENPQSHIPRPTPAPGSVSGGFHGTIDTASPQQRLAYAHALKFDTTDRATDTQRLMVVDSNGTHYGPLVTIQPEVGTVALVPAGLVRGRIVARMVNHSDTAYPELAIPAHDTAYYWIDKKGARGQWRAVYFARTAPGKLVRRANGDTSWVPARGGRRPVRDSVAVHVNPDSMFRARAKWLWSEVDEGTWTTCKVNGCCYSNSGQFTASQ